MGCVCITIFVAPQSMNDIKNQVLDLVESSDNVGWVGLSIFGKLFINHMVMTLQGKDPSHQVSGDTDSVTDQKGSC